MRNLVQVGGNTLTFSTYAVRQYCLMAGCTGLPEAIIISLLRGDLVTVPEIITAGLKATAFHDNKPYELPESTAYDLYEQAAEAGRVSEVLSAFAGSVVGKPTEEAGAYVEELMKTLLAEMENTTSDAKKKASDTAFPDWPDLEERAYQNGLSPRQFWDEAGYSQTLSWLGGRVQRRNDDELLLARLMRTVSYFIVQGWAKETPPPEELWPLPNDPKREVRKATKEDLLNLFVALGGREIPNTPESS